jgi:hypothetical protein
LIETDTVEALGACPGLFLFGDDVKDANLTGVFIGFSDTPPGGEGRQKGWREQKDAGARMGARN